MPVEVGVPARRVVQKRVPQRRVPARLQKRVPPRSVLGRRLPALKAQKVSFHNSANQCLLLTSAN